MPAGAIPLVTDASGGSALYRWTLVRSRPAAGGHPWSRLPHRLRQRHPTATGGFLLRCRRRCPRLP